MTPILIVEDEPGMIQVLKGFLAPLGTEIRIAKNIPEALREMAKVPWPDIVILDLRLPGSRPENTLQHIDELKRINPLAVVVVLTGMTDRGLPVLAEELGADGFAVKFDVQTQASLFEVLMQSLARRRSKPASGPSFTHSLDLIEELTRLITK